MNTLRDKGVLILLIFICILFWQPEFQTRAEGTGRDIILYYSNDVHGETEPCG